MMLALRDTQQPASGEHYTTSMRWSTVQSKGVTSSINYIACVPLCHKCSYMSGTETSNSKLGMPRCTQQQCGSSEQPRHRLATAAGGCTCTPGRRSWCCPCRWVSCYACQHPGTLQQGFQYISRVEKKSIQRCWRLGSSWVDCPCNKHELLQSKPQAQLCYYTPKPKPNSELAAGSSGVNKQPLSTPELTSLKHAVLVWYKLTNTSGPACACFNIHCTLYIPSSAKLLLLQP